MYDDLSKTHYNRLFKFAIRFALICLLFFLSWEIKWISDDGYIYLSYVQNYIDHGQIAFNVGERVDAATGFAWLIIITIVSSISPLLIEQNTILIGIVFYILSFFTFSYRRPSWISILVFGLLLASPYFIRSFATSGLETSLIMLLIVLCYRSRFENGYLLGILPFVRPELGIVILVSLLVRSNRKVIFVEILFSALMLSLFRYLCFGDVLPNTAFAKLGSSNWLQGAYYIQEFFLSYVALSLIILIYIFYFFVGLILGRERSASDKVAVFSAIALCVYTTSVGGDFMHGRFFVPSYVLLIAALSSSLYVCEKPTLLITAVIATVAILSIGSKPYTLVSHENWYKKISDEYIAYAKENPNISDWDHNNLHPWARDGRKLDRLAEYLGETVGVSAGGVGQKQFYSKSDQVYIFDLFSLTQAIGTAIDLEGYFRRIGHNANIPYYFVLMNKNVSLAPSPNPQLNELTEFHFKGETFVYTKYSTLEHLIQNGIFPINTKQKIDNFISKELNKPVLDSELVFFLKFRYEGNAEIVQLINRKFEILRKIEGTLPNWYSQNEALINAYNMVQIGKKNSMFSRYVQLLKNKSIHPIKLPENLIRFIRTDSGVCHVGNISEFMINDVSNVQVQIEAGKIRFSNISSTSQFVTLKFDLIQLRTICGFDPNYVSFQFHNLSSDPNNNYYYSSTHPGEKLRYHFDDRLKNLNTDENAKEVEFVFKIKPTSTSFVYLSVLSS